jgi:hypothetical protein
MVKSELISRAIVEKESTAADFFGTKKNRCKRSQNWVQVFSASMRIPIIRIPKLNNSLNKLYME